MTTEEGILNPITYLDNEDKIVKFTYSISSSNTDKIRFTIHPLKNTFYYRLITKESPLIQYILLTFILVALFIIFITQCIKKCFSKKETNNRYKYPSLVQPQVNIA